VGGIFSFLFGFIIVPLIVGFIVYWIIRTAVFGGMRDFEQWKHKQYGASDDYDYDYDYEQP
jgi:hypothetical protein